MSESKPTTEEIDQALAASQMPESAEIILHSATAELITLRAIWTKAEPLLRMFVNVPMALNDGDWECGFCAARMTSDEFDALGDDADEDTLSFWDKAARHMPHKPTCVVVVTRALLGEGG
jgi:hypothetical protein